VKEEWLSQSALTWSSRKKSASFPSLNSVDFKGAMRTTGDWWHLVISEKDTFWFGPDLP
jgi:hypothetical protein